MKTQTSQAVLPRSLRRNRAMLALCVAIVLLTAAWAMGWYAVGRPAGPLLLAVDQILLVGASHPSVVVFAVNDAASPTHSADPVAPVLSSRRHGGRRIAPPLAIFELGPDSPPVPYPPFAAAEVNRSQRDVRASLEVSPSPVTTSDFDENMRWFNGRPIRPVRTLTMQVTAYSPDERSCGLSADGITASGYSVWTNGMKMAAADTSVLPFGSLISVPGYDEENVIPVLDRGGAIKGNRLDVLYPTDTQARSWGSRRLAVTIWEYADGRPNGFKAAYIGAARAE